MDIQVFGSGYPRAGGGVRVMTSGYPRAGGGILVFRRARPSSPISPRPIPNLDLNPNLPSPPNLHLHLSLNLNLTLLLAAALLPGLPVRAEDAPAAAKDVIAAIAADEARAGAARLSVEITDRQGRYLAGEKPGDTEKRIADETKREARGSFTYGPAGWLKDLRVGASSKTSSSHARTAEVNGTLRTLVETSDITGEQKGGRILPVRTSVPGDVILSHRVARALEGIRWTSAKSEGERLTLEGKRGEEQHTLVVQRGPHPQVRTWSLDRVLTSPAGERFDQSYRCEVVPGKEPGTVDHADEWFVNPQVALITYRVTTVTQSEPAPDLKPEDLSVRFPKGTLVTDARFDTPVDYEVADEGLSDEAATQAAKLVAEGRARPGQPAPPFELKEPKGKTVRLGDFRGKPLVLVWFTPHSQPAVSEPAALARLLQRRAADYKAIQELSDDYLKKGVQFLGLNLAIERADEKEANSFRKRLNWQFPIATDAGGALMRRYGADMAVPKVAVVNGDGTLVYVRPGIDAEAISRELDRLIEKTK